VKSHLHTVQDRTTVLTSGERSWRALATGLLGSALGILAFLGPESFPSCTFHELTGYSCLTCGLTRSVLALIRGDLASSIGHHLMGPFLVLGLLWAMMHLGAEALTGRKRSTVSRSWQVLFSAALLWGTYGGIRLLCELAR